MYLAEKTIKSILSIKRPKTVKDLIEQTHNQCGLSKDTIIKTIRKLEDEETIKLGNQKISRRLPTSIKTYLFAIAKHVIQEERRHQFRIVLPSQESSKHISRAHRDSPDPSLQATQEEQCQLVRQAMSKLPFKQRQAFELFHLLGFSYKDASAIADCSEKVFECRLYRAHQSLRRMVKFTDP